MFDKSSIVVMENGNVVRIKFSVDVKSVKVDCFVFNIWVVFEKYGGLFFLYFGKILFCCVFFL